MKIKEIFGYALSSPYGERHCLGHPLKLKSIGIVEVHTDSGLVGYGETYAGVYAPELIEPAIHFLKNFLLGWDVSDIEGISRKLAQLPFLGRNGFLMSVSSAINIALWDILGKERQLPLYKLLSQSSCQKVLVYASSGSTVFSPQEIERDVNETLEKGFRSYKMRVGLQPWEIDLNRVATAKKLLSEERNLMIDAIMGTLDPPWSLKTALSRVEDLKVFQPYWLEEPLPPNDLDGLITLHQLSAIPLATGEALTGFFEFSEFIKARAVDFIQPDVTHCGGFGIAQEVIRMAAKNEIKVALHVWGGAIAIAANAHLAIATPQVDILEIPMMMLEITPIMFLSPPKIKGGYLLPPEEPGLGIRITDEMKSRYRLVQGSGYRI